LPPSQCGKYQQKKARSPQQFDRKVHRMALGKW
jgi:hypothetical protein